MPLERLGKERRTMTNTVPSLLGQLYEPEVVTRLAEAITRRLARSTKRPAKAHAWGSEDVLLITYADAISQEGEPPLRSLATFLKERVPGLISQVHLLPFFPFTSDDGFAVSDYLRVDPTHGDWADILALSEDVELVFDLVINHASSAHPRFVEFLEDRAPGRDYFLTAALNEDLSGVTRPRATPLLQTYDTAQGPRHVWCTFSRDQVDWDFSNPDVLYEFIDVFITYIERGASWVRLDAIAYLWKDTATPCVHLPQTHAVVKLLRAIAEEIDPGFKLLTETNVPMAENLSYFGDGDEAHIVYNFSLPPLLTHALVCGQSRHLTRWCQSLPTLPKGCTYLNFTASHDGIGLRPAEGILDEEELDHLLSTILAFDGRLTERTRPDGSLSPYEANISLFDAFKGTLAGPDGWQVERFLVSQALMLSLAGVPALYYNSLLSAPNNLEGMRETGRNRTINRRKWTMDEINARLDAPGGAPQRVLQGLKTMLGVRRGCAAFHPEAPQRCLAVDQRAFVLLREGSDATQVLCLYNLSADEICLSKDLLNLVGEVTYTERFLQGSVLSEGDVLRCSPYAIAWLELETSP